jgi:hypothetical protein
MKKPTIKAQLKELQMEHDLLTLNIVKTVGVKGAIHFLSKRIESDIQATDKDLEEHSNYVKFKWYSDYSEKQEIVNRIRYIKKVKKKFQLALKTLKTFESQLEKANQN